VESSVAGQVSLDEDVANDEALAALVAGKPVDGIQARDAQIQSQTEYGDQEDERETLGGRQRDSLSRA
jgi:CO/xanthine dehydrogenase Mo-binding subunit